jgi:hypothetical protein
MEFLGRENIDLLLEVCEDMKISRNTLINYAKVFYDNTSDTSSIDIMNLNKSFLLHMSHQSSTIGIYDKKEGNTTPLVEYKNEYALKVPPQPSFLDTAEVSTEELDILIQQKLKERDNELTEIQKLYNPDDKIESVKLIKISDVLADLNVFNDDDDDLIVNEVSKQKVSIGNTIVYNYNQNDPPQQLNSGVNMNDKIEKIFTTLTTIIEHMNIIDKKLDSLVVSIESFIK